MFASAAREVVFANPDIVRRVNKEFIPVALKAALVNGPPDGIEGRLYAELLRSMPAPQGIGTVNSDGKVLAWALSFDNDLQIPKFLDHALARFAEHPDAKQDVTAERFRRFPSDALPTVADTKQRPRIPNGHGLKEHCPAQPSLAPGTLVGSIVGRALDADGLPVANTRLQENYMEARLELEPSLQQAVTNAAADAGDQPFKLPESFALRLVSRTYLGMLDVDPTGSVQGALGFGTHVRFTGQQVAGPDGIVRIRVRGTSDASGGNDDIRRPDANWQHRVTLNWFGYLDLKNQRIAKLVLTAGGDERLTWQPQMFKIPNRIDAANLMAGHPIDFDGGVRYGIFAETSD